VQQSKRHLAAPKPSARLFNQFVSGSPFLRRRGETAIESDRQFPNIAGPGAPWLEDESAQMARPAFIYLRRNIGQYCYGNVCYRGALHLALGSFYGERITEKGVGLSYPITGQ
jgi:hypothetical protein